MNRRRLIIYGNGQMARMFVHFVKDDFEVAAFTVDRAVLTASMIDDIPVLPFEEIEQHLTPAHHFMMTIVGYSDMNRLRTRKHQEGLAKGYRFASYVHGSVLRHSNVEIGENTVVLDHVALHPGTRLGNDVFICSNASLGHGCTVEDGCWINSGVSIGGETVVGRGSMLGINATLADNIVLGERNFIGANTLVNRTTGDDEVHISAAGERFPMSSTAFLNFSQRRNP